MSKKPVKIAAITPHGAGGADDLLSAMMLSLMLRGWCVRGLIQSRRGIGALAEHALIDLEKGDRYLISQASEADALGCRVDSHALAGAAQVLQRARTADAELVVINRFGYLESQGKGFAPEMRDLISDGRPLLTIVHDEYLPSWRAFTKGGAAELTNDPLPITHWLSVNIRPCPFPVSCRGVALAHGCAIRDGETLAPHLGPGRVVR